MPFKITVTELSAPAQHPTSHGTTETIRYEQTIDYLDLRAVIDAVNSTPNTERKRALRSDAGKPRPAREIAGKAPEDLKASTWPGKKQ